jgi:methylated-DNA-[protein]-cysteine S-methyltransferase
MQAFWLSKLLFGPGHIHAPRGRKVGNVMQFTTRKSSPRTFRAGTRETRFAASARPRRTLAAAVFATDLDWIALAHENDVIYGLTFGHATPRQAVAALGRVLNTTEHTLSVAQHADDAESTPEIGGIIDRLRRFAAGEHVACAELRIDEAHLTSFGRRVVAACRRIPRGQTRSYGQLAAVCGSPGAARAVGQVMAKNRYPLIVPCHRVLAAGGALGGFSAPQGLAMKRRLLMMECQTMCVPQSS